MSYDYLNLDGEDMNRYYLSEPTCAHIHVDNLQLQKHNKFYFNIWKCSDCGQLFAPIPKTEICYEDQLPEMTDEEYSEWYENSFVIDGVRMGFFQNGKPQRETSHDDELLEIIESLENLKNAMDLEEVQEDLQKAIDFLEKL